MATPFIPIIGTNIKFDNKPIVSAILDHLNVSISLPDIFMIAPTEPKKELIKGLSKIIKKVILEIKNSGPKNILINFSKEKKIKIEINKE